MSREDSEEKSLIRKGALSTLGLLMPILGLVLLNRTGLFAWLEKIQKSAIDFKPLQFRESDYTLILGGVYAAIYIGRLIWKHDKEIKALERKLDDATRGAAPSRKTCRELCALIADGEALFIRDANQILFHPEEEKAYKAEMREWNVKVERILTIHVEKSVCDHFTAAGAVAHETDLAFGSIVGHSRQFYRGRLIRLKSIVNLRCPEQTETPSAVK